MNIDQKQQNKTESKIKSINLYNIGVISKYKKTTARKIIKIKKYEKNRIIIKMFLLLLIFF